MFHIRFLFRSHESLPINKTWSLTNEVLGRQKKKAISEELRKQFPHQSIDSLCNVFNENFIGEIGTIKHNNSGSKLDLGSSYVVRDNDQSLYWNHITMTSLQSAVSKMNVTAPGYDGIRLIDLKTNFDLLSGILLHFVNVLFDSGIIPDELKISTVSPLYKKGSKSDIKNYRPIGNVPALAKVLEKIINNKIQPFIEKSNIIPDYQHGFRPGSVPLIMQF